MNPHTDPTIRIGPSPPPRHVEALRLVLASLPADQRDRQLTAILRLVRDGHADLDGLFIAERAGRLAGAVWANTLAGRSAAVWPPQLIDDEPESTAAGLLTSLGAYLKRSGAHLAQSLLADGAGTDAARLRHGGFTQAAELLYLASPAGRFPATEPEGPLSFEAFAPDQRERLARLVEQTYVDTLDCPAMNDVRDTADVLDGYHQTGQFDPSRWLFVRHEAHDVGCLLLADFPEHDQWELVYMGLVPSARGQGFGRRIARHAQWLTGRAGRNRLVVAVDAANVPAVAGYHDRGFLTVESRTVFLRELAD